MRHREIIVPACAAFVIHLGLVFADFSFLGRAAPRLPGRTAIEVALVAAAPRKPAQTVEEPKELAPEPKELPKTVVKKQAITPRPRKRIEARHSASPTKRVEARPLEEEPTPVLQPVPIAPEPARPRDIKPAPPEGPPMADEATTELVPVEQKPSPAVAAAFQGKEFDRSPSEGPEPVSEARPDYLINEPPRYPRVARRRGFEGTTVLRVEVLPDGSPGSVEVHESSGYVVLDKAAVRAVKKWRFIPAKRGGAPIRSSVRVPVRFSLID